MDAIAAAALFGLPAQRIVEGDEVEAQLWIAIARRASDLHNTLMRNQGIHTANAVGQLFKRRG